jgi:DNA-binding SARP family transcriptional activator
VFELKILCGPALLLWNDRQVRLRPMERTFIVRLVTAQGFALAASRLARELWPGDPRLAAANTLRSHAAHIRAAAETVAGAAGRLLLVTDRVKHGGAYRLDLAPGQVDAVQMEALQVSGMRKRHQPHREEDAATDLQAALSLWGGAPLADAADLEFGRTQVKRLTDIYRETVITLAQIRIDQGRAQEVVTYLENLANVRRGDIRARELWVRALHQSGREGEALEICRHAIEDCKELGIPTASVDRLYQQAVRGDLSR